MLPACEPNELNEPLFQSKGLPIGNRRHSRLEICATSRAERWLRSGVLESDGREPNVTNEWGQTNEETKSETRSPNSEVRKPRSEID
ncbi:MAG: hypothetical protein C5B50_02615 [Verrucomicrobia bacterium]|nr:MAG: hypothetical protein C5B50_02615 [Verrucomicrobiota bacterium]